MGLLRSLAGMAASWLLVTAACFAAIHALPGDPVKTQLMRMNVAATPETIAAMSAAWGLDQPVERQFLHWAGGWLAMNWGVSFETGAGVGQDLLERLPWSAAIGIGGMTLAVCLGSALGFAAALRPRGLAERLSRVLAVGGQAIPAFALGLIALWLLAAEWHLIRPFSGGVVMRLVLPISLVAFFSLGSVSRLVCVGFAEVRRAPYYTTALAKGRTPAAALWHHGCRNAGLVLLSGIAPELAWVVGGTAVAEVIFGVPGVSERVVEAVTARDYAVLQAFVALVAAWVIVTLRLAGWLGRTLDPRAPA